MQVRRCLLGHVQTPGGEIGKWGLGDVLQLVYQCEGSFGGSFSVISKNVALQGFSGWFYASCWCWWQQARESRREGGAAPRLCYFTEQE